MGWCSGTEVFDDVVQELFTTEATEAVKQQIIVALIKGLERNDWDCHWDSQYALQPEVLAALRQVHPDWDFPS